MRVALGLLLAVSTLAAQDAKDTAEAHIAAAKAAASDDFQNLFQFATDLVQEAHAQRRGQGSSVRQLAASAPPDQGGRHPRTDRRGMPNR